jgi:hypothetical protein
MIYSPVVCVFVCLFCLFINFFKNFSRLNDMHVDFVIQHNPHLL